MRLSKGTSDRCQVSKEKEIKEVLSDFKYFYPLFILVFITKLIEKKDKNIYFK